MLAPHHFTQMVKFEIDSVAAAVARRRVKEDDMDPEVPPLYGVPDLHELRPRLPSDKAGDGESGVFHDEDTQQSDGWVWLWSENVWFLQSSDTWENATPGYKLPGDLKQTGAQWAKWFSDGNGSDEDLYLFRVIDEMPTNGLETDRLAIKAVLDVILLPRLATWKNLELITSNLAYARDPGCPTPPKNAEPLAIRGDTLHGGWLWWADRNIWVWFDGHDACLRYYVPIAGWALPRHDRKPAHMWMEELEGKPESEWPVVFRRAPRVFEAPVYLGIRADAEWEDYGSGYE